MEQINGFPLEHFYEIEGEESIRDRRFRLGNFVRRFQIRNVHNAPDPEELLLKIFTRLIAITQAIDGEAPKYSCIIRSPGLLQRPIQIPYRRFDQNTPQAIMNEFKARQESAQDVNLLDGPLHVEMITGPLKDEDEGAGRRRIAFDANIKLNTLIEVKNNDRFCLFYATELTRKWLNARQASRAKQKGINNLIEKTSLFWEQRRMRMVNGLFEKVRHVGLQPIPLNRDTYSASEFLPTLQAFYNIQYPNQYRLVLYDKYCNPKPLWKGEKRAKYDLPLLLKDEHFYGIKKLNVFFSARKFCVDCETAYQNDKSHTATCKAKCTKCCNHGAGPCEKQEGFEKECTDCNKYFYSHECYSRHLDQRVCELYKRCKECGLAYNAKSKKNPHKCFNRVCLRCYGYHEITGPCYVQKPEEKSRDDYRIVIYDFESSQDRKQGYGGGYLHEVNFVGAHILCTRCIKKGQWDSPDTETCKICGVNQERKRHWSGFEHADPLAEFLDWLLHLPDQYKTYAIAHYAGKYDMHLVLGDLYRQGGLTPHLIKKGEKLYQLAIRRKPGHIANTIFRDSYNWMPIKLEQMPKSLGLSVEASQDKGFFPHAFNTKANLMADQTLPHLPHPDYYTPHKMLEIKAEEFKKWYADCHTRSFCLKDALKEYCMNDVAILAHAVVKFRDLFINITGKDVVAESVTIAGACIDYFIERYMERGEVAIIPDKGYAKMDRQSGKALKFLKWFAFHHSMTIQHRDTAEGEYRLNGHFKLDGYVRRSGQRNLCIEVNGCAFHGHHCLYEGNEEAICPNGKTAAKNQEDDKRRREYIERFMEVEVYWECQIDEMLRTNGEMRRFFDACHDTGPLNPSDAYFGGRTGPLALKCDLEEAGEEVRNNYEIRCLDIVSLYPYINYSSEYPLGHGVYADVNRDVHWTIPQNNTYKGIIKCFVVPPSNLLIPVVPNRYNGKLMFPLCHACARQSEAKSQRRNKPAHEIAVEVMCPHTKWEDRGFVSTLTHLELNTALECGYEVRRVYSAITWTRWTEDLFKAYIKDFMKIKVEASGWPSWCKDDAIEQQRYIDAWKERFGIVIDRDNVKNNPGLKYIAKICLNSMWGRWSLRNDLSRDLVTNRPPELWRIINDTSNEIGSISCLIPKELYMLNYRKKGDYVQSHSKYNIVLSLFTTSAARIHLYKFMQKVAATPNCKLLYTDTDSIMLLCPRGQCPIVCDEMLGEMSDVYPDHDTRAYYATACKAYAVRLSEKKDQSVIKEVVKAKGITLSVAAAERLHYNRFKEMVNNFGDNSRIRVPGELFMPDSRRGEVVTRPVMKTFRGVFDKAMVYDLLNCYPFGFKGPYFMH